MIKKLLLIMAIFSQIVIAQENNLTIDMKPVADSNINWETTLILNAQNGMGKGVLIEIPSGLKMVPLSARINQTEMFLHNTNEMPAEASVISWDLSPEGIILLFQDGQFNTGDRIEVKTMTTQIKRTVGEDIVVNIRTAEKNNATIQFSEDIKDSSPLTLTIDN